MKTKRILPLTLILTLIVTPLLFAQYIPRFNSLQGYKLIVKSPQIYPGHLPVGVNSSKEALAYLGMAKKALKANTSDSMERAKVFLEKASVSNHEMYGTRGSRKKEKFVVVTNKAINLKANVVKRPVIPPVTKSDSIANKGEEETPPFIPEKPYQINCSNQPVFAGILLLFGFLVFRNSGRTLRYHGIFTFWTRDIFNGFIPPIRGPDPAYATAPLLLSVVKNGLVLAKRIPVYRQDSGFLFLREG